MYFPLLTDPGTNKAHRINMKTRIDAALLLALALTVIERR